MGIPEDYVVMHYPLSNFGLVGPDLGVAGLDLLWLDLARVYSLYKGSMYWSVLTCTSSRIPK